MAVRLYSLTVKGRRKTWVFDVLLDQKYIDDWRGDGLILDEVENVIPAWYVNLGLPVGVFCFMQDILHLKNPFSE